MTLSRIEAATDELRVHVAERLGGSDLEVGRLAIDPSDHGRPSSAPPPSRAVSTPAATGAAS
ncbi:hypothetical protein G7085_06560 [Tessaracoccus sp. HDW20]|uniref:hypothetical protein n=1 Tax=Tessaracoccus coleopterorum TaxID=2714950 RepID=UPI0018D36CA6|nr:hypothetical protein [Tessaracoccus coleopterorum]NHB84380.1 hypothetical protein [Tessaracoccus coleopterorum]